MSSEHPNITIQPLKLANLDAALAIQAQAYPDFLVEDAQAFASRFELPDGYCLAATNDGILVAYLLAHGWRSQSPPALGEVLAADGASEVLFIHDLAVGSVGRGLGVGRALVSHAFGLAAHEGLARAELIAVAGAASYWRRQGFLETGVNDELAAKVAGYGPDARWMTRDIPAGKWAK